MQTINDEDKTMTLDIPQFIANSIRTQSKIHHLDINVKAVKTDSIPASVKDLVVKDYGEKYLDDSDYVVFFWGPIEKNNIDKLFNTVDKALGKSANKLTDKDFKKLSMDSSDDGSQDQEDEDQDDNIEIDDVNDEEPEEDSEEEIDIEVDDDNEESEEDSEDEQLSEDEEEDIDIETAIEEQPNIPTSYFFLKITSK